MPVALVTGSARGIGREILLALAADGWDVAVHYRTSADAAAGVAATAGASGARTAILAADVTVESEARALVERTVAALGSIDLLVNNVGNYHHGPIAELSSDVWHDILASNLHACFYTCQQAVPHMREQGGGRIVNIGYAGAEIVKARPGIVAYHIAKTGVILFSKALARTEAAHGITVNVVSPGVIENSVTKPVGEIPMGRVGRFEEVVGAVRYLISPAAAYVTGVTIEVAGGWNV